MRTPQTEARRTTLLELVISLRGDEAWIVAQATRMVNSGVVELTGTFEGCTFDDAAPGTQPQPIGRRSIQ